MKAAQKKMIRLYRLIGKFNIGPITVIRDWMLVDRDSNNANRPGVENEQD